MTELTVFAEDAMLRHGRIGPSSKSLQKPSPGPLVHASLVKQAEGQKLK